EHGVLTNEAILADPPALAGLPHCLPSVERMRGSHADPSLDFDYTAATDRNELGQPVALRQQGTNGPVTLQEVTYDAKHRITDVAHPGFGATHASYDPNTDLLIEAIGPDAVASRIDRVDPITDAMTEFGLDRGAAGTWARSYRYDGLERLWKSWDDVGVAGEQDPEVELTYRYARSDGPATIARRGLV